MKIAHIAIKGVEASGGIEKYALELGSRLVIRGHEVVVYSMNRYKPVYTEYKGVTIKPLPSLQGRSLEKLSVTFLASLDQLLRGTSEIVHYHAFGQSILSFIPKLRGKKILLQGHGLEWMRSKWGVGGRLFFKLTERPSVRIADSVTVVSKVQQTYLKEKYGVDAAYIPPGIDDPVSRNPELIKALGLKGNDYILFASRLVREKGAHYLIDAYRRLETDKKLIIVGDVTNEDAYKNELRELAGATNANVIFTGFVSREMLQEFYSSAYLFVLPSEIEGLSAGLLEAMSYGNACLVSDIPENKEGLGDKGFYFKTKDADDLTAKLKMLLADEGIVVTKREAAKSHVMSAHSWDKVTDQIEELYKALLR
jgi:glycosyltransferase involved in cell wall biosynthesis